MNRRRIAFGGAALDGTGGIRQRPSHPLSVAGNPRTEHSSRPERWDSQFCGCRRRVPDSSGYSSHTPGPVRLRFPSNPTVFGSTAFTAKIAGTLPLTLNPGDSFSIAVTFSPTSTAQSNAQLNLPYVETVPPTATNTNTITLVASRHGPSFVLSYVLQTNPNVVPLQSGGTIPFPPTLVGTTAQAALSITNTGSGPGSVTGITISPGAFILQEVPLLPATVTAGQTLTVLVLFQPTAVGTNTGQVTITFASGAPVTINLTGSGSSPSLTYQLLDTNPPTTVSPGGTITLPNATLGQTTSVTLRVLNSGNANAHREYDQRRRTRV